MPSHQRQVIREAVTAALVAAATSAGARVYETRTKAWRPVDLPGIAIYSLGDQGMERVAPREQKRQMELAVEAACKVEEDADDALDALALEIEAAMDADPTFGGACQDSLLGETELAVVGTGDSQVGLVRLVYLVTYYSEQLAAGALDDLATVDTRYNLAGAQAAGNEAEDVLEDLDV